MTVGAEKDRWTMLFVYRGKHCPRCKRYLNKLNDSLTDWTDVLDVVVVSADSEEKALKIDWDDEIVQGTLVARDGKIVRIG